jgi:hypothetical protein
VHAARGNKVDEQSCRDDAGLVKSPELLCKQGSAPCQHHTGRTEQCKQCERVNPETGSAAEYILVKLVIRRRANAVGEQHDFSSCEDKQQYANRDNQHAFAAVTGDELKDFLPARESGANNRSNIRKPHLQDCLPPGQGIMFRLRASHLSSVKIMRKEDSKKKKEFFFFHVEIFSPFFPYLFFAIV